MTKQPLRIALLAALAAILSTSAAWSSPPVSNAMTVEEEWQLVLDTPNTTGDSPQFCTSFDAGNNIKFVTCWNYRSYPSFQDGGIQLQIWEDDTVVAVQDVDVSELNVTGDTITWKHVYRIQGSDVDMKIVGVNSQTWGNNINTTSVAKSGANIANFNSYDPQNSCNDAGISLGANRVSWFGMTGVSVYDDRGRRMVQDTTQRTVYSAPAP